MHQHEIISTIRIGSKSVFDFAKDFKKFTDAQCEIFGGTPGDLKDYWFLLFPGGGGGLEHRYSTTTYFSTSIFDRDISSYWWLISVSSHELFHAWNVKRIRPSEMVPYSYSEAKPTTLLWVSEGFTSYFGTLTMARGGNISIEEDIKHKKNLKEDNIIKTSNAEDNFIQKLFKKFKNGSENG